MRMRTRFQLATLVTAFTGLALAPTNATATALVFSDSGNLAIANMTGLLVGVTASPSICINWGGGSTCAGSSHGMSISGFSSIFAIGPGTISDEPLSGPFTQ